MTTLTSPTNQSYSIAYSNINALEEESGIDNTPKEKELLTYSKKKFVQFESFIEQERSKNELVIKVENSFQCKITDLPGVRNKIHHSGFGTEKLENNQQNKQRELLEKISSLEQTIKILKKQRQQLGYQIQTLKQCKEDFIIKHEHFKQIIWKKDETIGSQRQIIQSLNQKVNEIEKNNLNIKFYDEKNKQKDTKIRQLVKRLQKVLQINRGLEVEANQSRQKIMGLEKEIQMNAYNQLLENRVRIKESMAVNKENLDQNQRKSFQNPQRKGRLSNISSITLKTKSNSNTGRLRH